MGLVCVLGAVAVALLVLGGPAAFAGTPSAASCKPSLPDGQTLATLPGTAPIRRVAIPGALLRGPEASQRKHVKSYNWAGYDATGRRFVSVRATWLQPPLQAVPSALTYASFWVGLDGDGSSTVEQTGTSAYSQNGSVYYYAWYEMYPAGEVPIYNLAVRPGDVMTGIVKSHGAGHFTLTIANDTTGAKFTIAESCAAARRYSAEVIAEAPTDASTGELIPLADFGTVSFARCAFNGRPIRVFKWNRIDMISNSRSTVAATSALRARGGSFSVTSYPALNAVPKLKGLTPTSGPVGGTVTLTGSGFTAASAVCFCGTPACFTVRSATQITAIVPYGATSGPVTVTTPGGTATSAVSFKVIAAPTLAGFTPASGPVGTKVTLTGSGFAGASAVCFAGTPASFSVRSATQITATVPCGAASGPVTVSNVAGTATSVASFTVTGGPKLASFTPAWGPVGSRVTLNGSGFTGASAVCFAGAPAFFSVASDTQITATVPCGAASGPVTVTTAAGTATSAASFTVMLEPNPGPQPE
jgi:hypothetical protein